MPTALNRNVLLLSLAQAMMNTSNSLIVACAALVGYNLAATKALATLPPALLHLSAMLATVPAALLMRRWGRRVGFLSASGIALLGAVLSGVGILLQDFWLFSLGIVGFGIFNGFGSYFRFAAVESVSVEFKNRAIAYVLAGGVVAAVIGPNLANISRYWVEDAEFAGSFLALLGVFAIVALCVNQLRLSTPSQEDGEASGRSLRELLQVPAFSIAVFCAAVGFGLMSMIMTAAPLAMRHSHFGFGDTALAIQWHVLSMFVPSFFTGRLIERFGVLSILLLGSLLGVLCVAINVSGETLWHYWGGLIVLGLSWNFMFIGGTSLLTEQYRSEEKTQAQSFNDFTVFSLSTLGAFSAGLLHHSFGWVSVNMIALPLYGAAIVFVLYLMWRR